jgi:hypothetical protein
LRAYLLKTLVEGTSDIYNRKLGNCLLILVPTTSGLFKVAKPAYPLLVYLS